MKAAVRSTSSRLSLQPLSPSTWPVVPQQVTDSIVHLHSKQSDVVLLSVPCGQKGVHMRAGTIVRSYVSPPLPSEESQVKTQRSQSVLSSPAELNLKNSI